MPWFRVTAAVYRRALPLAGGRAGSLAALRQHARGCASMSWAWVARRVASDGRAQPQGAEKRPSEMCALDRPDRLVIRPHRPPVPKTCKQLYLGGWSSTMVRKSSQGTATLAGRSANSGRAVSPRMAASSPDALQVASPASTASVTRATWCMLGARLPHPLEGAGELRLGHRPLHLADTGEQRATFVARHDTQLHHRVEWQCVLCERDVPAVA